MKFFTHRVSPGSAGHLWQKSFSRHFLAVILNFCVKHKNAFILETVRDRAISTNFLTHRVSAESTSKSSQILFSRQFWRQS